MKLVTILLAAMLPLTLQAQSPYKVETFKTDSGREVPLSMTQHWHVRSGRPYSKKYPPTTPLSIPYWAFRSASHSE